MDRNNASCVTFGALDILLDWDKSLLELDSRHWAGLLSGNRLFVFFYLPFTFFSFFSFYVPLQVIEHHWTVLLFHSAGLALVHTEEWERVGGKVRKRAGQESHLGESWIEVELSILDLQQSPGVRRTLRKSPGKENKKTRTLRIGDHYLGVKRCNKVSCSLYTCEGIKCALIRVP